MSDPRHALGREAETAVERWLTALGWEILGRRYRPAIGGELDLVAVDPDGALVAIEVRARRTTRAGAAAWSVDGRRVSRLRAGLAAVAAAAAPRYRALRVDLVTVEPEPARPGLWRLLRLPGIG